jgi:RimJ/RimL family protein N-acetyltransferase
VRLADDDFVLRSWTENDVDALVTGLNDSEIARWMPAIPRPYTRDDAFAFIGGEVRPEHTALAIEVAGRVMGGIGMTSSRFSGSTSSPIQRTSRPSASPRRSDFSARASCAHTYATPTGVSAIR